MSTSLSFLTLQAAALAPSVPVGISTKKIPFEDEKHNIKGSIIIEVDNRSRKPTKLTFDFAPKTPTEYPFTNARRTLSIDLETGNGILTRKEYTDKEGKVYKEVGNRFVSDKLDRVFDEKTGRQFVRGYGLLGSVLGQLHEVRVGSSQYYFFTKHPLIKLYCENANTEKLSDELEQMIKEKK